MDKAQREYYLRQQLDTIKKELGETDEGPSDTGDYAEKIEKASLPDEAMKELELRKRLWDELESLSWPARNKARCLI